MITFGQLLLAISLPTFVAVLGLLFNNNGINRLDARIDRLDARIDRLDARVDKLAEEMMALRREMTEMRRDFHNQVTTLLNTIHAIDTRVVRLEEK